MTTELVDMFGEEVLDHTMVLLTCGDYLMGRPEQVLEMNTSLFLSLLPSLFGNLGNLAWGWIPAGWDGKFLGEPAASDAGQREQGRGKSLIYTNNACLTDVPAERAGPEADDRALSGASPRHQQSPTTGQGAGPHAAGEGNRVAERRKIDKQSFSDASQQGVSTLVLMSIMVLQI